MADLHNDILHVQINSRTLNICSKIPAGAEHILSSLYIYITVEKIHIHVHVYYLVHACV